MVDDNVRVIIECLPDEVDAAVRAADDLGIVEASYENLLQVVVPISQLTTLADTPSIRLVRLPLEPLADVVSEGVALINADDWQTASFNGTGVKVGILDGGFSGYTTRQGEGELPSTVTTWWAPSIGGPGSSVHGTACAEIAYDVAPDADFYLANFGTEVEMGNAVNWFITQGVDVISSSVGWPIGGPGDGTELICEIVDDAYAAGILWSQSAGNSAERHWQGDFSDSDADDWHNFSGTDESNAIYVSNGDYIRVGLRWDDTWGSSGNNYDLYLFDDSSQYPVDGSNYPQDGDDDPWEFLYYTATYTGYYHIVIDGWYASQTKNLEIFCYHHDLQYPVASHSLTVPADSGNAMSVGAVDYSTPTALESFSSQGPTTDSRIKPDLVATDNVSTATYGTGFFGTSASAPHVAGAAALVKECYPIYTNAQIQSFLEGRAVELGAGGKDNLFGSGRLDLGSITLPTMEAINEAVGGYYNTAPVLSNFGFDDDTNLDDGWYQMDSYTGSWISLFTDVSGTFWDDDGWTVPGFAGLSEGSHTVYFRASDDVGNFEGESGEWSWQFYKDTVPPTDPTSVSSPSHTLSIWSSDNTVDISWTDATDVTSLLDGYSVLWDTNTDTIPNQTKDIEDGVQSANSTELADGSSHYFHIRSVDNAGNWQSTVHLGPFFIDAVPPTDPTSVSSPSHTLSIWSRDNTVDISWTDATDATSLLDGYSILWDTNASTTPDQTKDIEEGVQSANSTALADGSSHYFHISSVDNAGNWQSTVHLGPFFIDATSPTMESIAEDEGQYYNTAPVLSNFGFDDNLVLDDGSYQMDSYTGTWTALFTDVFDTDVSDLAVASDNLTIYATDRQRDKFYRSTDAGVNWTELTNPTGATEPQLIAVTPDDADFVAIVADDNEVYISDDAFTTWDTLDLELADATITVQDLDISVAFDGNHYVAVVGDDGTDAKVYYYEIGAIGADWELISDEVGFAGDQDVAGAVAFSPNFASDEVMSDQIMVVVTANLSDAIYFQVFCFYQLKWNEDIGGFADYPVVIVSDDGITGLDSASISLAPDYHGAWDDRRIAFVGLTVSGDADAIATSGIYRVDDDDLAVLKTQEQIHSIAYNGANLVAGEYDTTVVWRSADPLATTPTVSSSLTSPGGDDEVVVAWAGSDVVAGTSGNESAFAVSTDNGENFTDISLDGTSWDSDNWTIPGFGSLSEDSHTIYFSASDNATNVEGESGEWSWRFKATDLPVLRSGAVSPTSGYTSATFTYSVTYADAEDDAPDYITISIDGGASENMTVKAGQDSDYTNGEIYEYWIIGSNLGVGTHTFKFFANDGTDNATGDSSDISSHVGPTVSSPPAPPAGGGGGGGGGGGLPGVTSVGGEHTGKGKFEWDVTCESEDKCVELFIPEGTIGKGPNDTFLRVIKIFETEVLPPIPEHTNYIGLVYNFHYEGTTFNPPVDLTIRHDESLIPEEIDENSLIIATWDKYASEWIELESTVDTEKNTVTTKIDHFTKFTILAHTRPANFTVTNLSIAPKEIDLGESATVSVTVTNTGDLAGICELCLKKDDAIAQTKEITLTGGSSEKVTFSVTRDTAGECCVDVNGLIGSFVIKEEAPVVEEEIEPTPEPAAIPVPETIPTPTPKPPFNWGLLVGILAGIAAIGSVTYYIVRKRMKAKGSG